MDPTLAIVIGSRAQRPPARALREHFACVWFHHFTEPVDGPIAVVPDGCIDLQWIDGVLRVAGPGYADQPHLTRDARRMSALTPATILRQLAG
jgi:hypothetical protein